MKPTKQQIINFCKEVESEGLIIDRNITGQAIAKKFNLSLWEGQQSVDFYLNQI